jgi:hypothetical protein
VQKLLWIKMDRYNQPQQQQQQQQQQEQQQQQAT